LVEKVQTNLSTMATLPVSSEMYLFGTALSHMGEAIIKISRIISAYLAIFFNILMLSMLAQTKGFLQPKCSKNMLADEH